MKESDKLTFAVPITDISQFIEIMKENNIEARLSEKYKKELLLTPRFTTS
ncbi:MAG: hypothetical protein E6663_00310 [Staphylococcus lugdunensis]|nr:hypothetical protein [Staphylococcus lugdunensis]DAL13900.1 MAG TPA_asm: hypothetical protein [Caudoviricetes sp.]